MASIFDSASLIFDGRLGAGASGKLFPLKPNVKDLTGNFFTVTRAGTKIVLGSNGLYQTVAANVPAFEFNTDGTYRGLSVEPGATNLFTGYTLTAGGMTSQTVNNELSAVNLMYTGVENTANIQRERSANITTASPYAISGIFKNLPATRYFKLIGSRVGMSSFAGCTISNTGAVVSETVANSTRVTFLPNGYIFVECTVTPSDGDPHTAFARVTLTTDSGPSGGAIYTGTGETWILGALQLETGSVATSRVFVNAGTASRVADVVSLTGASSLIGQASGWVYAKVNLRTYTTSVSRRIFDLYTDGNNRITLTYEAAGTLSIVIVNGGVLQAQILSGVVTAGTYQIAVAYSLNDVVFYVNGVQIGTDTSATIPATSIVGIGSGSGGTQLGDHVLAVANGLTRISNATLQAITTP